MPVPVQLTDDEIAALRQSMKENGLLRAIQLMPDDKRALARRDIREGLQLLLNQRNNGKPQ